uniref:Uncharacterized protein n=1 Tax=viral metagenome TaxID=1070528 RepID=A0A6M3J8X5_9ZZZZ
MSAAASIADDTNHVAATVYYPDSGGVSLDERSFFLLGITADDCTVSVEVSMDGTYWVDITDLAVEDIESGGLGGPVVFAAATSVIWIAWVMPAELARLKVVYPDATNQFSATISRRSL